MVPLLSDFFQRDVLVQAGLAGGGCFFDDRGFTSQIPNSNNIRIQCLVGPAIARAHLLTKGIYGPRFMVDEEYAHVHNTPDTEKYFYTSKHQSEKSSGMIPHSEFRWWKNQNGVSTMVKDRLNKLNLQIKREKADAQSTYSHLESVISQEIEGLEKRRKHLQTFLDMLNDDQPYF